jgi:AraC family transcriptional activator of pobA
MNSRPASARPRPSASNEVPRYLLYGEPPGSSDEWVAHVELLGERCRHQGWTIAPHSHSDFGQLVYVRRGRGMLTIDDHATAFEAPCVILVPSHSVHSFTYEEDTDGWVVTIADFYLRHFNSRLSQLAGLWSVPSVVAVPSNSDDPDDLHAAAMRLQRELDGREAGYAIAVEIQLMAMLLITLRRRITEPAAWQDRAPNQTRIVDEYRALIELHYQENWKVGHFAAALGVSLAQLRTACDNVVGMGPLKLLQNRLVSEAKRNLVFNDMTIEQLAYDLGFSDPAYFARFFRKEVGEPPAAFRSKMRRTGDAALRRPPG